MSAGGVHVRRYMSHCRIGVETYRDGGPSEPSRGRGRIGRNVKSSRSCLLPEFRSLVVTCYNNTLPCSADPAHHVSPAIRVQMLCSVLTRPGRPSLRTFLRRASRTLRHRYRPRARYVRPHPITSSPSFPAHREIIAAWEHS